MDVWRIMRYCVCCLFFCAFVIFCFAQETNVVAVLEQVQEISMWGMIVDLWMLGGICALICSVCFFARS